MVSIQQRKRGLMSKFTQFALSEGLIGALTKLKYVDMTPVQEAVIPQILKGDSLLVRSQTGSGKTHSFLVPLFEKINEKENKVQAIVIAPTRELARQIYDFAIEINKLHKNLRILLLAGGLEKTRNSEKLALGPQLVIATPGRLKDIGFENSVITLETVETIVLDEADMLMDQGFFELVSQILVSLKSAQILVFSATIPVKLNHIIEKFVGKSHVVDIDKQQKTSGQVTHYAIDIHHRSKYEAALDFIKWKNPYLLIVFASNKKDVNEMYEFLINHHYKVGLMHGDLQSRERKSMLKRIKNDEFPIIVASDIAARGMDIDNISEVLSLDLPHDLDFYFHRAGRTGRYDKSGDSYVFFDHDTFPTIEKLENLGAQFTYMLYREGEFIEKPLNRRVKRVSSVDRVDDELKTKINLAKSKTKTTKVKPGYKKKVQKAVEQVKRKHRRKLINDKVMETVRNVKRKDAKE